MRWFPQFLNLAVSHCFSSMLDFDGDTGTAFQLTPARPCDERLAGVLSRHGAACALGIGVSMASSAQNVQSQVASTSCRTSHELSAKLSTPPPLLRWQRTPTDEACRSCCEPVREQRRRASEAEAEAREAVGARAELRLSLLGLRLGLICIFRV